MKDNLIMDKLPKANTFSSKLLNLNSNVFPDPSGEGSGGAQLNSDFFEKEEESEFLLNDSLSSQFSNQIKSGPSRKMVYFLMFFNICRSFIAIGVLAIPFGLSKIGNQVSFLICRNLIWLCFLSDYHCYQSYKFQLP